MPVNDATRNYLKADATARLKAREADGVIQSGWTVDIASSQVAGDDDFIGLVIGLSFGRSLEQIFYTVTVS